MKHILIPTDFSDKSAAALRVGLELSRKTNSQLTLLHTVPQPVLVGGWVDEIVSGTNHKANDEPAKFSFESEEMNDWLKVELIRNDAVHLYKDIVQVAMVSDTPTGIEHTVDFSKTDLVIIGTGKDHRPVHVTSAITGKLNCPILSVPEGWEWKNLDRIMITSDFHEDDSDLLNPVLNLVRLYGATIDLIHLRDENVFEKKDVQHFNRLADKLLEFEGFTYKLVCGEDYVQMITKAAKENNTDLLVMKCRNCGIPGGLIDQLVVKLNLPMYILPKGNH